MESKCSKGYERVDGKCKQKLARIRNPPIYNFGGVHIGSGFLGFLTLIFITLKLVNVLNWSWWWVLSPLWVPAAIVLGIYLIFLLISKGFGK
jgi:hypothetical protein